MQLITLIFLSGMIAVTAQTLLMREMLAAFGGNELCIGIIISHWLLGCAAGSALGSTMISRGWCSARRCFSASFLGTALFVFCALFFTRELRSILHLLPGEGIPLPITYAASLVMLFPLCVFIGMQFPAGNSLLQDSYGKRSVGLVYAAESAGFGVGAMVVIALLLFSLNSSAIMLGAVALCLCAAALIVFQRRGYILVAGILVCSLFIPFGSRGIDRMTFSAVLPGFEIKEIRNSPYGQIAAAERSDQMSLFYDNIPVPSTDANAERTEEFIYLPLLHCGHPHEILLIGGIQSNIPVLLAYPGIGHIDAVELDPQLAEMEYRYSTCDLAGMLADGRLGAYYTDGYRFLRDSQKQYDAILLGLDYPSTLSLNRYYTREFFQLVSNRLSPDGVLALRLPGSSAFLSGPLTNINRSMYDTLRIIFRSVRTVPGDETLFLASPATALPNESEVARRFTSLHTRTEFLTEKSIVFTLDPEKESWLMNQMAKNRSKEFINSSSSPRGVYYSLIYWQSLFAEGFACLYTFASAYAWLFFAGAILWILFTTHVYQATAFASGAASMGLQMISIWGFQIALGNIYLWLGLLTSAFMTGSGTGSILVSRKLSVLENKRFIALTEFGFCFWSIAWWMLLRSGIASAWLFILFSLGNGFLLGLQFPVLAEYSMISGVRNGMMYAWDLLGGWLCAVFVGSIFIPARGLEQTILALLLLKIATSRHWGGILLGRWN